MLVKRLKEQNEVASMTESVTVAPTTLPQHEPIATPCTDECGTNDKSPLANPYDKQPEAPPRFRESSNKNCVFHSRILSSEKPLSDRLFLDIEDENDDETKIDSFAPIALAMSKSALRRFEVRKVTPISKSNVNMKRRGILSVSSISKPLPPRLSVSWVPKRPRSNQQHLVLDFKTR